MKVRIIFGVLIITLGLLAAIGPQTVFYPCPFEGQNGDKGLRVTDGSINDDGTVNIVRWVPMRCYWGARSMIGFGGMITLLGIALIVFRSVKTRFGLTLGVFFSGIVALFIPTDVLVGICRVATMECRTHFGPAITAISILLIAVSLLYMVHLARKKAQ